MNILKFFINTVDGLNEHVGRYMAWAVIAMVLVQFLVVIMRYVFGIGSIMMQETVVYLHASMFMIASGYTLLHDGHVRVDIFYREAAPKTKAWVDLLGSLFFLLPVCVLISWASYKYIGTSWRVFEGSRETSGIQAVFLLKTTIWIFTGLMGLQALSIVARSILIMKGQGLPSQHDEVIV